MKIISKNLVSLAAIVLGLGGCATIPDFLPPTLSAFTPEKMMIVQQGMTSERVLELFGEPKSVNQAVCGASTGHKWNCTTWAYGEFPYKRAGFTFDSGGVPMVLNNFEIHGDGKELPTAFTTETVLRVRQGIGSEEILRLFGLPGSVRQAVCGTATGSPWTCTTWEYGEFPYDRASFTFASRDGFLVLNNFDVQRK